MTAHQVRSVTRHYEQLQGLRLVPLAVVFVMSGFWRMGRAGLPGDHRAAVWLFVAVAASLVTSWPIRAWYSRRFGRTTQTLRRSGLVGFVAIGVGVFVAIALPSSAPSAFVGTVLLVMGLRHDPVRKHYLVAALVFF